jgi:hypothetical protein
MLILFGPNLHLSAPQADKPPVKRCEFVDRIDAYTCRQIEPALRDAFEQHLIDCGPCQRAVHLGRVSNPLNYHNRSVGMPCAAQTRRKP